MGRILSGAMAASLVLALAAGCSSDNKDDVLSPSDEDNVDTPVDDKAQAYIDVIAITGQFDDPSDDDDFPLSPEGARCYGEAYVEVLGVERLEAKVTPEEIEANPENDSADWGIEIAKDEGVEIFRGMVDCQPDVVEAYGQAVAEEMEEGGWSGFDADCLGDVDPSDIEDVMGPSIAGGEDYVPNEEEATALVDWLMGCGDARAMVLSTFESDARLPESAVACADENLDDDMVRDLMIANAASTEAETPESAAVVELVRECVAG